MRVKIKTWEEMLKDPQVQTLNEPVYLGEDILYHTGDQVHFPLRMEMELPEDRIITVYRDHSLGGTSHHLGTYGVWHIWSFMVAERLPELRGAEEEG